jgi:hypothetical protein
MKRTTKTPAPTAPTPNPIVETIHEYYDVYTRGHARVSVELTHSKWSTFARSYGTSGDPAWREHASRDAARAFARTWLGGAS